jgi:phosphomevalonate kinase
MTKPLLIGLSGKKRSGKNTVAEIFSKHLGHDRCTTIGFADKLKQEVAHAFDVDVPYVETNKELFRKTLQSWGELRREGWGKDYWINKLHHTILENFDKDYIFIADVRYRNEMEYIRDNNGLVFRVTRLWRGVPLDDKDAHSSETQLDFETFDKEFIAEHRYELETEVQNYLRESSIFA